MVVTHGIKFFVFLMVIFSLGAAQSQPKAADLCLVTNEDGTGTIITTDNAEWASYEQQGAAKIGEGAVDNGDGTVTISIPRCRLVHPDYLIEIEAVAVIPLDRIKDGA